MVVPESKVEQKQGFRCHFLTLLPPIYLKELISQVVRPCYSRVVQLSCEPTIQAQAQTSLSLLQSLWTGMALEFRPSKKGEKEKTLGGPGIQVNSRTSLDS